jgi:hypothetical protein
MSELPETKDELIRKIETGGSVPSSDPPRQAAKAKLESLLIGELTDGLTQLTNELSHARQEMQHAADAASKHTRALVWATWVLAFLTGVLALATGDRSVQIRTALAGDEQDTAE